MGDVVRKDELAELRRRVKEADAVVVAKVAETGRSAARRLPPASEHDPQWRTAVVVARAARRAT